MEKQGPYKYKANPKKKNKKMRKNIFNANNLKRVTRGIKAAYLYAHVRSDVATEEATKTTAE